MKVVMPLFCFLGTNYGVLVVDSYARTVNRHKKKRSSEKEQKETMSEAHLPRWLGVIF